jgi:hypothetical protein
MLPCVPASTQLTLRSVDPRLRGALEREAARRKQSLNKTMLALLAEALGLAESAPREPYDDLDELAGTWSKAESDRFDAALAAQRQVDPKLWR